LARAALKPSTLYGYHSSLDKHLLPAFGEARLSQITPIGVEKFVQSKMAAGKGAKTLRNQLLLLQSVFSLAEELKVVTDCPVRKKHKQKVVARTACDSGRIHAFRSTGLVLNTAEKRASDSCASGPVRFHLEIRWACGF
jgi:hypothetical protein